MENVAAKGAGRRERVLPLEGPYTSEVEASFDKLMPPGMEPLRLFRVLAHNPRVLRRVQRGGLLDPGSITLRLRELAVLRTCALCGGEYEWGVHVALFGEAASFTSKELAATARPIDEGSWAEDERLVLRLCDELHASARVSDALWAELAAHFDDAQLIELVVLAGQYHTISFVVNALRVAPEPWAAPFPRRAIEAPAGRAATAPLQQDGARDDVGNGAMDEAELQELVDSLLHDLGGAFGIAPVRIGVSLGLYRRLSERGPMTSSELAAATGLAERYVREWLAYNAASRYVRYDPAEGRFTLSPEQAAVFADEASPLYMAPAFDAAAAYLDNQPSVQAAFESGAGVGWHAQAGCLSCAVARFFRPGYRSAIVDEWLPALEGVVAKLERGARVADVGCGHGYSTYYMAEAFPRSEFVGLDFHEASIDAARAHAESHGSPPNLRFEVSSAKALAREGYNLVTTFDCLHDMGDPAGAATRIRDALAPDGRWMIVEPFAHDALEDNLGPVARLYYAASTMVCVPTSLDQEVGEALGAQAGEARLRDVVARGGFRFLRRAAETRFNLVLEAIP